MAGINLPELYAKLKIAVDQNRMDEVRHAQKMVGDAIERSERSAAGLNRELGKTTREAQRLQQATTGIGQNLEKFFERLSRLNTAGSQIRGLALDIRDFSDTLSVDLRRYAENYVNAFKQTERSAAAWAQAQYRIESASMRTGRVIAEQMLPGMERAARFAETIASFVERHPEVVKGITVVGGGLATIAGAAFAVGTTVQFIGAIFEIPEKLKSIAETVKSVIGGPAKALEAAAEFGSDQKELEAAALENVAAEKMLQAARLNAIAAGRMGIAAGAGGAASAAGGAAAATAAGGAAAGGFLAQLKALLTRPLFGGVAGAATAARLASIGAGGGGVAALPAGAALAAGVTPLTLLGGLGLGGLASSALARSGVNQSGPIQALNQAVNKLTSGLLGFQFTGPGQALGQTASIGAHALGGLFGGPELANKWFTAVADLVGAIDENTAAQLNVANSGGALDPLDVSPFKDQAIQAFVEYNREVMQAQDDYDRERIRMNNQLQKDLLQLDADYLRQRGEIIRDFNRQQAREFYEFSRGQLRAQLEFNRQQAREAEERNIQMLRQERDFNRELARAELEYFRSREELAERHGKDQLNREREFQKMMRRAMEDHQDRVFDLAGQGDALGLVRERRAFEKERRRAEEDFRDQQSAAEESYKEQLKELEASFAEQRELRLEEYELRLRDEAEDWARRRAQAEQDFAERQAEERKDFAERQAQARQAHNEQLEDLRRANQDQKNELIRRNNEALAELKSRFDREKIMREARFREQLNQIDANLLGEQKKRQEFYEKMAIDFKDWLQNMREQIKDEGADPYAATLLTNAERRAAGLPPLGEEEEERASSTSGRGRQHGGYVDFGRYWLAEAGEEYVLSNPTTRAMERAMGGRLTQDGLVGLARGYSGGMQLTQHFTFQGSFTEGDKLWFRQAARQETEAVLLAIIRRARGG